jgi:2',3'-cyclic-nucleotide 2'-phosphodiesterase (5'-nucleotidase family)
MARAVRGHVQPDHARQADQVLLNPDFPSYNFDVIDGVTYQIDLSQASRYNNDGEVVAPTRTGSST